MTAVTPAQQAQPTSIIKETLRSFKRCWKTILPLLLILFLVQIFWIQIRPNIEVPMPVTEACERQVDAVTCRKENAAQIKQEATLALETKIPALPRLLLVWGLSSLFVNIMAYLISLAYLRRAIQTPPTASLSHYWRFLKLIIWMYVRPILWNVIPILGQIMYCRSLYRYTLVGPLVLLGYKTPLETSWEITKGSVWRLIGVGFAIALPIYIALILAIFLIGGSLEDFTRFAAANSTTPLQDYPFVILHQVAFILFFSLGTLLPFAAYRVLSVQQKAAHPETSPST